MIKNLSKVVLYVDNQEDTVSFWTEKVGFIITNQQEVSNGIKWVEVAPNKSSEASLVIYDKKLMDKQNPSKNTGVPSLIFSSKNIKETHAYLKSRGVQVDEFMDMSYGKMFNFFDEDGNSFLIRD